MTLLHAFDVVAVTVGRYTEPFDSGPLLDTHWLGVRGVGETVRWGFDPGSGPFLDGGVPQPPTLSSTRLYSSGTNWMTSPRSAGTLGRTAISELRMLWQRSVGSWADTGHS